MAFAKISATAGYVPQRVVTNDELAAVMPTSDDWIVSHTGIHTRHYAMDGENTSDLATAVGRQLLQQAKLEADQIDLLIVSTITPDALTPSTACIVQGKLGADNAVAFDISAACAGFVFAMSIADKMMAGGTFRHAMIISAEVNSKMMDFTDRTSAVFFGDAAGGVILTRTEKPEEEFLVTEKIQSDGRQAATIHSGQIQPLTTIAGDNYPTTDAFYQDGRAVFEFATNTVPQQIRTMLATAQINPDQLDKVICHQANLRIIEAICQKLNLPFDRFMHTVERYGNTSSAGIPLTLARLTPSADQTQLILLSGFGAGLDYGSMVIKL
ncbi:3-oxoacyl-ACP synthase [Paucilactobacillus vaccinostercus DSM 20634]|uniref:Beta-ketoacyl-[acyl-carrier-protein] synthase III n=1 Tax=Paucilactobacillus vaccinostercus DSM 20634 TaxID=1423813 RepID=A0A0R2A9P7_9LACO|nr:beta-ketoacyl-ACP synthase III [Paucilactobacillus vaccinostercus]KRM60406.1 3-oxoacyl-ACP synthase [Paucilactobacillus vaccinostercus DSM 20634]